MGKVIYLLYGILIFNLTSCKLWVENDEGLRKKSPVIKEESTETDPIPKQETGIDKTVYEIWNNFIKNNPDFKDDELPQSDFFHNNKDDADRLASLTLNGKKKASSGLYDLYKKYNVSLPKVGNKQIITNFDGQAIVIIMTTSVDIIPFNKISKEYAVLDMGTTVEPLKKWKKTHWDFFESILKESGESPNEYMLVVCEGFETIWINNK